MSIYLRLSATLLALLTLTACRPEKPADSAEPQASGGKPSAAYTPFLRPAAEGNHPIAAYQAVPFPKGALKLSSPASVSGPAMTGIARPATYWADGSVQWLRVETVWPDGVGDTQPILLQFGQAPATEARREFQFEADDKGGITWLHRASGVRFTITPEASLIPIKEPKPEPSTDPVFLDEHGQYAWAMRHADLNVGEPPIPLHPRLLRQTVEEENALYTVICLQGNGGDRAPGNGLEWQLRLTLYHAVPIVRAEITWLALWDVKAYALHSAKWTVRTGQPWSGFRDLGGRTASQIVILNEPNGRGTTTLDESQMPHEWPSGERDGLVASLPQGVHLAVGIPNFSRLGPNHLSGKADGIEIASWSDRSGLALDLRRSTLRSDFGTSDTDIRWNGTGVSRTVYATFAVASTAEQAASMARYEANRDWLWLANVDDLCATHVLGPYGRVAIAENAQMMRSMYANLCFVRASRDFWRWNGWANFGDMRTNHALGDTVARGLHAGHWALNGRYGWRNASETLNTGFIQIGILMNDRSLALMGIDNALHVQDVDIFHGSFFRENRGDQGGMRRRNRDHWSGSVQAQYSLPYGVYFTQWLTGNRRGTDALKGLRGFASRNDPGNSVFPSLAWLLHYQETRDPAALAEAERLLDLSAQWWKAAGKTPLEGLAALYAGNFRRISDGMHTLIRFHQATEDPCYLRAIEESTRAHPIEASKGDLSDLFVLAYLRANGVNGLPEYALAKEVLARFTPQNLPSPDEIRHADYQTLRTLITTQLPPAGNPMYRETAHIGKRAVELPLLLEQFGLQAGRQQTP